MEVIFQFIDLDSSEALKEHTKQKLSTLKIDNLIRANVRFSKTQDKHDENKSCDITLEIPGNDLHVQRTAVHYEAAVNDCVDVLHLQWNKIKEKQSPR